MQLRVSLDILADFFRMDMPAAARAGRELPVITGFPDDAVILSVMHDMIRHEAMFLVQSEQFEPIWPGFEVPWMELEVKSEVVAIAKDDAS